jgi:uncharacterized protein YdeI (YjbR/CyaY-like superfamily)
MTEAGLVAVGAARKTGRWQAAYTNQRPSEAPADLAKALEADAAAWQGFARFAPSYRRIYVGWVVDAKQPATRLRRIAAVVRRARNGRKPGMSSFYH